MPLFTEWLLKILTILKPYPNQLAILSWEPRAALFSKVTPHLRILKIPRASEQSSIFGGQNLEVGYPPGVVSPAALI
jgi:hypothetical protein